MDLDVARAQRGRDLEPDEARADHDRAARRLGALDDRPAIGERAQRVDMRLVGARDRQADRLGAGREQQPVVGDRAPVGEHDLARTRIDAGDVRLEPQIDAVLGIEAVRAQRHPILRRAAGEIVLGQVRPVDGRRIVVAQHDDAALIVLAPEHLGRREAGRAAADDHDPVRRSTRWLAAWLRFRLRPLLAHEDLAVALLDRPARDGAQGRGAQGFARAQVEAGVMPGDSARCRRPRARRRAGRGNACSAPRPRTSPSRGGPAGPARRRHGRRACRRRQGRRGRRPRPDRGR